MSYDASPNDLSRRAATFVDKILKGAKPADLPVEQPTKFELFINLIAAKQIGLKISAQRAGESGSGDSMSTGIRHEATGNSKRVQIAPPCSALWSWASSVRPTRSSRPKYRRSVGSMLVPLRSAVAASYSHANSVHLVTSKARTLRSSFAVLTTSSSASQPWPMSWSVSKSTCSSRLQVTRLSPRKKATKTIPIVFAGVPDPVAIGLVDSLARPGGNVTGFSTIAPMLAGKCLELLKETIPRLSRVAVLWNPKTSASAQSWKESQLAARELGLQLYSTGVSSADRFDGAFQEAIKASSGALTVIASPLVNTNQKRIAESASQTPAAGDLLAGRFCRQRRLDVLRTRPHRTLPACGGLCGNKILKGTKPAELPVEQPAKFEFIINLKAAKQIGLTIPPNVLARADRVIR